jgi:hypothetical protein
LMYCEIGAACGGGTASVMPGTGGK